MPAPLLPLLALGSLGLVAHFTMKPRGPSGPTRALPPPLPAPTGIVHPWALSPPPPPPPAPPTPVVGPANPLPPPLPVSPVPPVVAPPPMPSTNTREDVLRDVNNMLTSDAPPPPPPLPVVPVPAPIAPPPLPVVPVPVVTPNPSATTPAPVVTPPPSPAPFVVTPKPAPAPVVVVQPQPATPTPQEPTTVQPPPGFSPSAAKAQAARVAANLKKGRDQYSRPNLTAWQRLAGLAADGIYGGETAGALAWYLQGQPSVAPRPFFKPTTPTPYRWSAQATAALSTRAAS